MNESTVVKEGLLSLGVYVILLLISLFVPILFMIGLVLLPIPFVVFSSKYGWKHSLFLLGAAIGMTLFFATSISLPTTVLAGAGGIMIGFSIHKNLSAYETWAQGTLGFIAGLLFTFAFSQFVLGINWATELAIALEESLEMSVELLNQVGLGDQTQEQLGALEEQMLLFTKLIPAGIAIISILLAFITQWISYKVINRLNKKQLRFPLFRNLRFPVAIIWIYFFSLIFSFINIESDIIYLVVHNVLALTGLFMIIQGLSFAFFFAHYKKWSKLLPLLLVGLTILLPFFLLYLVRILGIIDIGFGLRDRLSMKEKK